MSQFIMEDRYTPAERRAHSTINLLFWFSLISLFVFAGILHSSLLFCGDNSIELHEAQKLLAGGTYVTDFFDTSPPMILYLFIPPVLVAKYFSLDIFLVFRVYIFSLVLCCTLLCRSLGNVIFSAHDRKLNAIFAFSIAFLCLLLPSYELGQRDYLLVILSLPYFLTVSLYLQNSAVKPLIGIFVGVLAGLGIGIKPFFIITPILVELYVVGYKKNIFACLRPDSITIFVVLAIYTVIALLVNPDYFQIIVPYSIRNYYPGVAIPWSKIIFSPICILSYLVIIFAMILYGHLERYKILTSILCIGLISFVLIYIMQRVEFYYHILLPFIISTLLSLFLFLQFISKNTTQIRYGFIVLLEILFILLLWVKQPILWTLCVLQPYGFWAYLLISFTIIGFLTQNKKSILKLFSALLITFSIGYWFLFESLRLDINSFPAVHHFILTIIVLLILFTLTIRNTAFNKIQLFHFFLLGSLIFVYPIILIYDAYSWIAERKLEALPLIGYMKTHMLHQSTYLFSNTAAYTFPHIDYANVTSVSRFPFLWMVPAFVKKTYLLPDSLSKESINQDKDFLINAIAEDLFTKKPDYVFVDIKKNKKNFAVEYQINHRTSFTKLNIEYLDYFSTNKNFQQAWKSYHYINTIMAGPKDNEFYKYEIYKRQ
jgi:hypothetical protein